MKLIIENWKRFSEALLNEDIAPYTNLKGYVLQALRDLGGEDVLGDIAELAFGEWAQANSKIDYNPDRDPSSEIVNEEEWFYSVKAALESLQVDGRVRLTQGGPDDPDSEEFYAIVHQEDLK
tara:strand:- start:262 stop:627 length:366 start_codon:yes stop_codon:yes gene_type:complete